jgi:hypothetical protein
MGVQPMTICFVFDLVSCILRSLLTNVCHVCHGASQGCIIVSFLKHNLNNQNPMKAWDDLNFPKAPILFLNHSFLGATSWKPQTWNQWVSVHKWPASGCTKSEGGWWWSAQNHSNASSFFLDSYFCFFLDLKLSLHVFSQFKWMVWGTPHFWTHKWSRHWYDYIHPFIIWQVEQHPFNPY